MASEDLLFLDQPWPSIHLIFQWGRKWIIALLKFLIAFPTGQSPLDKLVKHDVNIALRTSWRAVFNCLDSILYWFVLMGFRLTRHLHLAFPFIALLLQRMCEGEFILTFPVDSGGIHYIGKVVNCIINIIRMLRGNTYLNLCLYGYLQNIKSVSFCELEVSLEHLDFLL